MNFKNFLSFGFLGFLLFTGCAALEEMEGSGKHYTVKSFSLPPGSTDSVTFNVNAQGSISATLSTRGLASSEEGGTDSMMLALYNPRDAVMVQNEGNPHERLKLRYRVPRSAQEGAWKVMLTNKSERTISGTLKVYYPYEDMGGRTTSSDTTAQQGGSSQPYPESSPESSPPTSQDSGYGGGYGDSGYGSEPPPPSSSSGGGYGDQTQTSSSGGYDGSGGGQQAPSSQTTSSGYGTEPAPASQPPSQTQAPAPSEPQQTPQASPQRKILVVNPKILQVATAKPVRYGVLLNTFDLTLGKAERDKFYFHVRREGTIDVYVRWNRNNTNRNVKLAVILNGPARENALARKDGLGNVHLQYHVKQSDIVAGKMWKVSIARFDEMQVSGNIGRDIAQFRPITGNIQVRYPKE